LRVRPENTIDSAASEPTAKPNSSPVAPVWHTALLIAGILLLSVAGAMEFRVPNAAVNRLQTYVITASTELCMVAWIWFGLRLRKVPFGSLMGSRRLSLRSMAIDLGFALGFWIAALFVLANIGVYWTLIEATIKQRPLFSPGRQLAPDASQQRTLHALTQLAPANGHEIAAWIGLCVIAGFAEELVFRGYLQRQFTAWARGAAAAGVVVSALLFGMAHGYQGVRNMVLLSVFGALFSLLALYRRSLRPGMIAHGWHDLFAGLVLAFLKAHHKL